MFKRFFMGSIAVFLLASSLALAIPKTPKAHASVAFEPKLLCVLPSQSLDSGNTGYHVPNGWLSVQILNRATLKVTFTPGAHQCTDSPKGNKLAGTSIERIDGTTLMKPLLDGVYRDKQLDDDARNNFAYRHESSGGDENESVIDEFDNSHLPSDDFGDINKIISPQEIRKFLADSNGKKGAEITFGVEEDAVKNIDCPDFTNGNFVLSAEDNAKNFEWDCIGNSADIRPGRSGYRLTKDNSSTGVSYVFEGNIQAFNITFNYDGDNKIVHVAKDENQTFEYCDSKKNFRINGCAGDRYIDVTKERIKADLKQGNINPTYGQEVKEYLEKESGSSKSEKVAVAGTSSESAQGTAEAEGQSNTDTNGNTSLQLDCDTQLFNPLTWLICPIIAAANEVVEQLDNAIVKELNINTEEYFGEAGDAFSTSGEFYTVWSSFRTIGLILLLIAALIMVISQAIGVGPFDAYTVKKIMPRIILAIIFMTLSWQICKFLIDITNELSLALRVVIQSPFSGVGSPIVGGKTSAAAGILAIYAGLGLGILGLLSFVLTALMAVLIAFIILTLRKMVIIFLVLISPFAIACYILPNTQKAWRLWWDTFSKALLMFPIIMGFIAVGRVFAAVTDASNKNHDSLFAQVVVMVAYFGPYFALPTAFRLAGGAIANIAGIANDRGRGAFDRLKNFRQNRSKDRIGKFRSGGYYNTDTRRGRFGNKLGTYMFDTDEKIPYELGKRGVPGFTGANQRMKSQIHHESDKQTKEFAQMINLAGGNDKTGAVMGGMMGRLSDHTRAEFKREGLIDDKGNFRGLKTAADYDTAARIMAASDDATEVQGAAGLRAIKGHALNLNREGKGFTNVAAAGGLIVASHGFMTEKDLVDVGKTVESQTDGEFADMMMTQMEVNGAGSGLKATYSHSRDKKTGELITGTQAGRDWDLALSKGYGEIAGQKKHAVEKDVNALAEVISMASVTDQEKPAVIQSLIDSGMSEEVAKKKVNDPNIDAKAEAARKTLEQMAVYTPGATDSYTIVKQTMDKLGIPIPGQAVIDVNTGKPTGGGGGFKDGQAAGDGTVGKPTTLK